MLDSRRYSIVYEEKMLMDACFVGADEDSGLEQGDISKLGIIKLECFRILLMGRKPYNCTNHGASFDMRPVSEKAKKIGWHRVTCVLSIIADTHERIMDQM